MFSGVLPIISLASVPIARILLSSSDTATTDGSFKTIPIPGTNTRILVVPKSIPSFFGPIVIWAYDTRPSYNEAMDENSKRKEAKEPLIVEVIPVVRGITKQALSYFTTDVFEVGSFVKVPVRSGEVLGIVSSIRDARESKSSIKTASFVLKKLSRIDGVTGLSPAFIKSSEKAALYYGATIGSVLGALLPKLFLLSPELIGTPSKQQKTSNKREPLIIQLEDTERLSEYKSIVRERFAQKKSVLFIVPTQEDAMRVYDVLSKGIEEYVFITAGKSPVKLKEHLKKAISTDHAILFITTAAYISFERPDFDAIIIEKENSRAYRPHARPFVHPKTFAEILAKETGRTLILGDSILSIETLWREKEGQYAELSPLKWRMKSDLDIEIVDMKKKMVEQKGMKKDFEIISKEMKSMIEDAVKEKRKVFLFCARKGLSPSTVCGDCGTVLPCLNCDAPIVLHEKKNDLGKLEPIFLCHACGSKRDTHTRCDNCKSWKLVTLGIGIDRVAKELEKLFPKTLLCILDKDHAPTRVKASLIAKRFATEKGGILLGTELAFLYLEKIPYGGIVSLDPLFSIPDFGINEKIFYLVSRLKEITEEKLMIQTRNIGKDVFTLASTGNVLDFYRNEISERNELFYPPFSIFIKVSNEGSIIDIKDKATWLQNLFGDWKPDFIEERGKKRGRTILSMIIRLPRESWPDMAVYQKLLLLPPEFLIKVDPESIL